MSRRSLIIGDGDDITYNLIDCRATFQNDLSSYKTGNKQMPSAQVLFGSVTARVFYVGK